MRKSLTFYQFLGFIVTSILGTLLHFLYEWTDIKFIALFSGVNESVWEHMKILFFPLLAYAVFESRYFYNDYRNFWCVKLIGILSGLLSIPTMYYTYTGALGVSADWFNITIYFLAAAITYKTETKMLKSKKMFCISQIAALIILVLITMLFMLFTFFPPKIPLFQDPVTKLYGLI